MNKKQIIGLMVVLSTGCSSPRPFIPATGPDVNEEERQPARPVRLQTVEQWRVDAASVYARMIEYVTIFDEAPGSGSQDTSVQTCSRKLDAAVSFRPGSSHLQPGYGGNRAELARIGKELSDITADPANRLLAVRITGYASPDGSTARNEELAVARAVRFRNYLSRQATIPADCISVERCVEDWEGLARLAAATGKPYSDRLAAVLAADRQPDARRKALKAIDKGRAWKDMEQTLFARLRRMEIEVVYETEEVQPLAPANQSPAADLMGLSFRFDSRPDKLTLDELLQLSRLYRPGTGQYREVYEWMAYHFPDCIVAQLNAGAAALADGDREAARFFLERTKDDGRAHINLGVLALMENDHRTATDWFRKALPVNPVLARRNLEVIKKETY